MKKDIKNKILELAKTLNLKENEITHINENDFKTVENKKYRVLSRDESIEISDEFYTEIISNMDNIIEVLDEYELDPYTFYSQVEDSTISIDFEKLRENSLELYTEEKLNKLGIFKSSKKLSDYSKIFDGDYRVLLEHFSTFDVEEVAQYLTEFIGTGYAIAKDGEEIESDNYSIYLI